MKLKCRLTPLLTSHNSMATPMHPGGQHTRSPSRLYATTVTQAGCCSQSHFYDNNKERLSLQFLRQWRGGTEKDDLWDACIVAVLKALLEEGSGPHRPSSAQPRSPVYDLLAQAESAAWMHRIVIALAEPKGRQGALGWRCHRPSGYEDHSHISTMGRCSHRAGMLTHSPNLRCRAEGRLWSARGVVQR